jgi:hypothetical protein
VYIVQRAYSAASSADAHHDIGRGHGQDQAQIPPELVAAAEAALGSEIAAIHLARVRSLARANPAFAEALLADELHRWQAVATAGAASAGDRS